MFDASLAFMASAVVPCLVTGRALERTGNTGYSGQPTSALFVARDGHRVSLGVVQQHQFELLAKLLGHEEWLQRSALRGPGHATGRIRRGAGGTLGRVRASAMPRTGSQC